MNQIAIVAALPPISPDSPCGSDLDLAGDTEFTGFMLTREGQLPRSYYLFDSEKIDFPGTFLIAEKLLQRTHDIRLLLLVAKFSILHRDIAGFAHWIAVIAWLLRSHWEEVHPRAFEGDYTERLGQLTSLDDGKSLLILLALKYATLLETSREGALSYRAQLVASGKEAPRVVKGLDLKGQTAVSPEEKFMPAKTIERLLRDIELAKLSAMHQTLSGLVASLASIEATTIERVGHEKAIEFARLRPLVKEMTEFVHDALVRRDPSLAPPPVVAPRDDAVGESARVEAPPSPPPAFETRAAVDAALGAALGYFALSEPSSPALLLIRQARETLGKNLYEVMKLLAPAHADNARVFVGPDSAFTVPVKSLANVAPQLEILRDPPPPARSRAAALELVDAVAAHLRRVEPSSPAPYLLERARNLASRDFLSLLHDVLPEDALAALKKGK